MNQRRLTTKRPASRYVNCTFDAGEQLDFIRAEKMSPVILPVADLMLGWLRESVIVL